MKMILNRHAIVLAALLQVMPIVRTFFTNPATVSNFAIILRWGIGAAAALESVDAVSGASPTFTLPTNFVATVGTAFSNSMIVSLANTGNSASTSDGFILTNLLNSSDHSAFFSNGQSTTNAAPPGLKCTCISLNNANSIFGSFTGTPTTPGNYILSATCLSPGNGSVHANIFFTITGSLAPPPVISNQPSSATVVAGGNASFSVVAGGATSYQWFFNTNTAIAKATNATLALSNVQASNAGYYRVTVSNAGGSTNSANALLTVLLPPNITSQPSNVTATANGNAVFSVTVTGTTPLNYQWKKNNSVLANSGNISGANSNILTISNVSTNDAAIYSVIVTNIAGSIASSNATLTVAFPPTIAAQPANVSVFAGSNVSFTVSANGTAPLNFQWKKNNSPLANGGNISGATSSMLNLANVSIGDAATYSVTVTNSVGSTSSSNATLTVFAPPTFTLQAGSRTATIGTTTIFTTAISGTAPLSYQWSKNNLPLTDGGNISGATSNILTISNLSTNDSGNYSLTVTNFYGTATGSNALLTVVKAPIPPSITAQPANQSVVAGNLVSFSVTATGTDPLSYQWMKNGSAISGATSGIFTITHPQSSDAANYSVTITNIAGSVISSNATLTVFTPPAFLTQAGNRTITVGSTTIFAATVSGTAPLIYQWFKDGLPLADSGNVSGSASNILTVANVSTNDAGNYWLSVSNFYGNATSSNAVLTVSTATGRPVITLQPTSQSAGVGGSVSFSVVAKGALPLHYQWRKGTSKISGATNSVLTLTNLKTANNGKYSVIVTNPAGSVVSSNAVLKVFTPPSFKNQAGSRSVKAGITTVFKASVAGTSPFAFQWFKDGIALTNGGNIIGALTINLTVKNPGVADAGAYWLTVTNPAGGIVSSNAVLAVLFPPIIQMQPQSQAVAIGEGSSSATFSVTASGSNPLFYQWRKNGNKIFGATNSTFTISRVQTSNAGTYSIVVNNSVGSVISAGAALTVTADGSGDNVIQNNIAYTVVANKMPVGLRGDVAANHSMTLQFDGQPGTNYVIEASTDLSSWKQIYSTNAPPDGHCEFIDADVTNYPIRFYRIRTP